VQVTKPMKELNADAIAGLKNMNSSIWRAVSVPGMFSMSPLRASSR
jgi:hypothetical protein